MPKKIRELKAMLHQAGFSYRSSKGSHTVWSHPLLSYSLTLSGKDGEDARALSRNRCGKCFRRFREFKKATPRGRRMTSHYSISIQWSDEDQKYIVNLSEFVPYAHTHGNTYEEALKNAQEVLELLIEDYQAREKPMPKPCKFEQNKVVSYAN